MTAEALPPEREAEIRAQAQGAGVAPADLVAAAAHIRRLLLESVPEAHRPDFVALLEAARTAPSASRPRVRALVGIVAALVAAGSLAAGMAGVLPGPVQDTVDDGGEIIGIHLPTGDEMREVDVVDIPGDTPRWDGGHHGDAPADGHSHEF